MTKGIRRYPRLDQAHGAPRLDLSKIKDSRALIDKFLFEGSIQLGYGAFGTRKTTLYLLAAWAVSQGVPFLGLKTLRRPVLYLDYENPASVLKTYCLDLDIKLDDLMFIIWDRAAKPLPLPNDGWFKRFVRRCQEDTGHAPWIIFDSWTSLLREGESGNQLDHATRIFRAIRELCDQGATVTIIDHTGKNKGSQEPIGTSAKMTQMDTAHYFRAQKKESEGLALDGRSSHMVIEVESFLKRYAPKGEGSFSFEVRTNMNKKDEWHVSSITPIEDPAVKQARDIQTLKELIRHNPTLGQEELAAEIKTVLKLSRDAARDLLKKGLGLYWEMVSVGPKKLTYRLKSQKSDPIR